nr:hypothetical protein [Riemerella columbina]
MDFDTLHRKRIRKKARTLEQIYNDLIARVSSLAVKTELTDKIYQFRNNKKVLLQIEESLKEYYNKTLQTIYTGTDQQWRFANEKYNALRIATLERIANHISKETYYRELAKVSKSPHNLEALKAYQERKIGKFTISERVWHITKQMKSELELAIDVSLSEGMSANELARKVKKYLNEPDRLYRRVRDKHGNLVLSRHAKAYNPGRGVYRSSHKNALRLASNEINTAYRESEQLRMLQNNDIVGVEICLSPQHAIFDICDQLKGKYPKDFIWSKWHVGCKCHRKTILKSDEELIKELNSNQDLPPDTSKNYIGEPPKHFDKWVSQNKERFKNWKHKPEWWEKNKGMIENSEIKGLMLKAKQSEDEVSKVISQLTQKYNGYATLINFKSYQSIQRKLQLELNGDISQIKDSIRATIILPKEKMRNLELYLEKSSIFERVKVQKPERFMGYSGILTNIKATNGISAEIQFNTEKMIYAKEKPTNAIRIIGKKRWDEIRKETGLKGGLGHKYYEEYRLLDMNIPKQLERMKELEELSKNYYKNFR